ncbi:type II secretion system protein GspC [Escherichia coli]|nr:type II secretion system protein GspC [Escherichia coli]NEM17139.1 type II secretion system protein GspC [Escherichia coli]NEM27815.1 type II secretion system protein GspC [Escherichia coli]NEM32161.1 type II secretion system protein GspC [Escherichia coli]NEM37558.1 type II secretion system protein GspC [Escherichia coli]
MPTLRFPFHLANHNKDAAINILIIFISIGSIIFNVNYFHTTIVKNGQIINQPTNAFQSDFSLAALWRNENHAGVKDANPVAVNQETPKLSIALNGIVLTSNDETSFVLINEGSEQKRYSLNEALESAPGTFIRKINKTSVVFETHGHYEKVTLHPGLPDIIKQPDSESQNVLADYIIATPIRDGEQVYGLRLNPRKGLNAFTTSLLQPGDIALRINNLSLTHPDEVSQALSLLLTQQSAQFTILRNGVPRLINVSVGELTGMNGLRHERTQ